MEDTTLKVTMPLGKFPASTDTSPQSVVLQLRVSDHDSVVELLQKPEGREREEYALIALRIGLLSLKHAGGQIDADAVRHEGERLSDPRPIWHRVLVQFELFVPCPAAR
jgi:hypothetical protein